MNLAAETNAPVLAAEVTPEAKPEELEKAPVETIAPPAEPAVQAPQTWAEPEVVPEEPAPAPAPAPAPLPPELPATVSLIPLVALLGATSLVFALLLRRIS